VSIDRASILEKWQLTEIELSEIMNANPSMRGLVFGYVAEYKLLKMFFSGPEFLDVHKSDDHDRKKKGDLTVTYKGREFMIECKSLQSNSIKKTDNGYFGRYQCDASDRRTVSLADGVKVETTCLLVENLILLPSISSPLKKNGVLVSPRMTNYQEVLIRNILPKFVNDYLRLLCLFLGLYLLHISKVLFHFLIF